MRDENDKLDNMAACNIMRFIRNGEERGEETSTLELVDSSENETELAFTFKRDRFYLRIRTAELRRLLKGATP